MKKTSHLRFWFLLILPLIVVAAFIWIEQFLMEQSSAEIALNEQIPETTKKVLELNMDLAKLFTTLATALIGGITYYLKSTFKEFPVHTRFSRIATAGSLLGAIFSIFFGHLWIAGMRNQLANDFFNSRGPELLWPERMQYYFFIIALCWFGLLAFEREQVRAKPSNDSG